MHDRLTFSKHMVRAPVLSLVVFLLFVSFPQELFASSNSASVLLQKARACKEKLYGSAAKKKYRHNWERCIRSHEKVYKGFPSTNEAVYAMLGAGELWAYLYRYSSKESDIDTAISLYRELVKHHQDHRLADDAQYRLGEIFYKYKKDPMQAYVEFLKVEVKFPNGDMRARATKMMNQLERVLGKRLVAEEQRKRETAEKKQLVVVKDIRHWSTPSYTRVVVDLESQVIYREHLLKRDPSLRKPRRLFVDLLNARISKDIESSIPIKDGLLRRARAGQYDKRTVRVVLDIDNMESYKIFHLYDPFRIVVDVRGKERLLKPEKQIVAQKAPEKPKQTKRDEKGISLAKQLGLGVKRIIIDPGHGGKDPGALGKNGIEEKDVMLKLAKILADRVRDDLKCEAILTRTSDTFLALEDRTAIANTKKGDLFISLHTNAHRDRRVSGIETYILNIALDEDAMNLAALENATSTKNIGDLQMILNDLMLNTKINESGRLAQFVHKGLMKELRKGYKRVNSRGVRQAPFYVLIGAEMPAILVEVGYITNNIENGRLCSPAYLNRTADGIMKGIASYIEDMELTYKGG
ncbi:MAG: N-acetylmuramoyl-L-alanine amidase [Deltaproteobacteria bacterium]|nr:MAG: N-acetylmuramoyl-L-alanine amidase [Deltaproteobacteria bacterium]